MVRIDMDKPKSCEVCRFNISGRCAVSGELVAVTRCQLEDWITRTVKNRCGEKNELELTAGGACMMRGKHWPGMWKEDRVVKNCPNCGQPLDPERTRCAYCGTPYYDLSTITMGKPLFLTIDVAGKPLSVRALCNSIEITQNPYEIPTINMEFVVCRGLKE